MSNRREFMGGLISAGVAASGQTTGQTPASRILGANDRVRFGIIGCGARGTEDFGFAVKCTNVEAVAAADIYERRFEGVKKAAPNIKTYLDFRKLLDDKSIDAVLIVTPQHNHCLNLRPCDSSRQGRVSGEDHGVHAQSRPPHEAGI